MAVGIFEFEVRGLAGGSFWFSLVRNLVRWLCEASEDAGTVETRLATRASERKLAEDWVGAAEELDEGAGRFLLFWI